MEQISGILNINKGEGLTSHDVVGKLRRILGLRRIGHTGTLDPGATGVLVVCVGQATRIAQYLEAMEKSYVAELVLGTTTTTEDRDGEILQTKPVAVTEKQLEAALSKFRGPIQQLPPMYSAVHHKGRRLYELAREGQVVAREPREVTIHKLELEEFQSPVAKIHVECSKGTYIRTLCADLGAELGTGGHMGKLVRTGVGQFSLDDAVSIEAVEIAKNEGKLEKFLIPMGQGLASWPVVQVEEEGARTVANGGKIPGASVGMVRIEDRAGTLLALARCEDGICQPVRVFH